MGTRGTEQTTGEVTKELELKVGEAAEVDDSGAYPLLRSAPQSPRSRGLEQESANREEAERDGPTCSNDRIIGPISITNDASI